VRPAERDRDADPLRDDVVRASEVEVGSLASLLPRMKSMIVPPMLWAITQNVPPCAKVRAQRLPPPSAPPFVAFTISLATSPAACAS